MMCTLLRRNLFILFSFFPIVLFSQALQEQMLVNGIVHDTIRCAATPTQSYAVYLPLKYSSDLKWPVIFFYDPGARGKLPVARYKSLAEKFGCILIGSNNSRNGSFDLVEKAEAAMLSDVSKRFSIDDKRLFVSGFSGGARSSVFLAIKRKAYAGIIACGAAFPPLRKLTRNQSSLFIEVIGNEDMNFTEALEVEQYLQEIKYPHSLLLFEGGHEWPPLDVYDIALFWQVSSLAPLEWSRLRYDSIQRDTEIRMLNKAYQEVDSGDVCMAHFNLRQFVNNGLTTSDSLLQLNKQITRNLDVADQEKELKRIVAEENGRRDDFFKRFLEVRNIKVDSAFDEVEWKTFINSQNRLSKSKNRQKVLMAKRLKQNMVINCYEEYNHSFKNRDYFHSSLVARIWSMIDKEYRGTLMLARVYAVQGMKRKALDALEKLEKLGFADSALILGDSSFSILHNEKQFISLLEKINSNQQGKKP